jgi:sporadic carbohydrate cluster protein (TIGR04323 family)
MHNRLDHRWDNQTLNYDLQKHNWPEWALETAREIHPQLDQLENAHKHLTATDVVDLGKYLQRACGSEEFQDRVDSYYGEYVPDLVDDEFQIQRFFTIRVVIPDQARAGRLLSFHQGIWVGNGLGLRTIWTPFTRTWGSNTMQITSWEHSDHLTQSIYDEQWDHDRIQNECLSRCWPVELEPGQAHLFQQHHIHGNINNTTDITRWSMDGRILVRGGQWLRKVPGGYFRFIGERADDRPINANQRWITYAGWNSRFSKGIPLPMQRNTIHEYLDPHGVKINDYQFENEFLDWLPGLRKFIVSGSVDAIAMCSMHALPDNETWRNEILELALDHGVELHFANELTSLRNHLDLAHVKRVMQFADQGSADPNYILGLDYDS